VVAFSPRGATMAFVSSAGGGNTVLRVWNMAAHRQIGKPLSTDDSVQAVAFSPDGTMFATGEDLQTSYLWDANSHRRAGPGLTIGDGFGVVSSIAFSADRKTLATAVGDTVQLWDVATGQPIGSEIIAGDGGQAAVAFSPDGELLATADRDGSVRLWDVATHEQIGTAITPGRAGGVNAVAFSPDAALLATADADGTVQLINVAFPRDLVSAVCAIAGRSMTPFQWRSYVPAEPYQKIC
jgi:WD40 repeat protein